MELKLTFDDFKGHIMMNVASNIERLEVMDEIGINIMELAGDSAKAQTAFQKTSVIVKLLKSSEKHYKEVKLSKKHKEYKSFEDLNADADCQAVMMECATKALLGLGGKEGKK